MNRDLSIQKLAKECILDTLEKCENLKNKDNLLKSYKSIIKGLGAMIIQNGLYGTVVFYRSKINPKSEDKKAAEKNTLNIF
ncbi:type III-B CRISPR module-associated protein Cmr5 [Oceanotoga sp. DSM 15011]|uniref:type III-B CRISPR module-associated protein Cmr5 n=1 Tax=Oceanotoga sp. DSM 15011 TaxID=2984951 RepID=UPI0021F4E3B9|nr:type III-B CRISPR module-associated protein Cmr5 [Oceanotoga sp. DSM 15011]UYP01297.1 type III-B CRISPR module-associated protein Cmr5 [Oceanotoga sp. DSM 15011]